jgi:hypothetical protein
MFVESSSSSSVGSGFITECMWFRENLAHAGQQSKLSGIFTAKIIQYLQIKLCTGVYGLLVVSFFLWQYINI